MGWMFLGRHKPSVTPATMPAEKAYGSALGIDPEKGTTSFDQRLRKEYRLHTLQYWFVASLANGLLWMQIVLGAAMTALGATRTSAAQTAIIYLGAASTITAGLLTYFKSRNQPNRARQLRQALRSVRNNMDDQSRELAGLTPEQAQEAAKKIIKQYNDALAEAAANYPDFWVSLGDLRKFVPAEDPTAAPGGKGEGEGEKRPGESGTGGAGIHTSPPPLFSPEQPDSHTTSSETQAEPVAEQALPSAPAMKLE